MEKSDPAVKKSKSIIDADLQSRQLATYGMCVMERLAGAAVLIIGMNGLGVEVAKNIVLANVRKVTLADDCVASWSDMGSHFYLQPDDVGCTNRAEACRRSIKDVNTGVEVVCCTEPISEELLAAHDAVCVCDCVCRGAGDELPFAWDDICRRRGVSFIRCEARGVFGYIFDDFTSPGSSSPGTFSVANEGHVVALISNSNPAVVTVENCRRISSKTVRFSGIQGMTELNGTCAEIAAQEYVALSASEGRLLVTLEGVDSSSMGVYRNGGCMTAAPFDTVYNFQPYRHAWHSNPQSENNAENWPLVGDLGQTRHHRGRQCEANGIPNVHVTRMLRAAFRTLENYAGRKLRAGDEEAALALVDDICRTIHVFDPQDFFFDDEFDAATGLDGRAAVVQGMRPFFTTFAMSCCGCLSPVAACVAGIAAQEIIKSVAGMGDPLSQFMFFSFLDVLPQPLPSFADVAPRNSRYDSHVAVLGARFHSELRALKVCVVGAGATGSELLKDFAMCGVGTEKAFNVLVADDDVVERSNLSRQFLYRSADIKKKKAVCAAAAAHAMNCDFKAAGKSQRVDEQTPSSFGSNCDLTVMALDSAVARKCVARRCQVGFSVPQPVLNLGTMGLSLSTDAIIPHVTTTYANMAGPSTAPQELSCQERTVPKTMRHCVSLAKRQFELLFVGLPKEEEPLSLIPVRDWNECIVWARRLFDWCNQTWVEDIKGQYGSSDCIWQGRALPDAVPFDHSDQLVQQFVGAAAVLKGAASGIELPKPSDQKQDLFADIALASLPLQSVALPEDVARLPSRVTHFEKDDDNNFHVDFIAACANLKAKMFHITPAISHFEAKIQAGGIVAAVATSTSVASALTCLDVFRVALHKRSPGSVSFFGRYMHLSYPRSFSVASPSAPLTSTVSSASGHFQWTEWQSYVQAPSSAMSVRQLVQWLTQTQHLPVKILQYEGFPPLYNDLEALNESAMEMKLVDAIVQKAGRCVVEDSAHVDISIELHLQGGQSHSALPRLRVVFDSL